MTDPLNITNEMAQFDRKNREFYDSLTEEQKKKFSPFLMIRWGSTVVNESRDFQEFYVIATNERLNRRFFDLGRHPKLQWLLATTVSPGMGVKKHQWIAPKKKEAGASALRRQIAELYPHLRDDEIDLMAKITTKKELDDYIRDHGHSK